MNNNGSVLFSGVVHFISLNTWMKTKELNEVVMLLEADS